MPTKHRWRARPRAAASTRPPLTRLAAAAALLALAAAATASAHGDPASHYLEMERLYPAFADRPTPKRELRLLGLLGAAERRGYPIKVALVASAGDLTDNPAMLGHPQRYAEFVASELALGDSLAAPVVVVSPQGFGVAGEQLRGGRLRPLARADAHRLVRGLEVPEGAGSDALADAATAAVRRLAQAGGRPLPARVPPATILSATTTRPDAPDDGGVGLWGIAALFAAVFVPTVLIFELWLRASRRTQHEPGR